MSVAFVLSVIGANLVWPIALYSSRAFASGQRSTVARPVGSAQEAQGPHEYAAGLS